MDNENHRSIMIHEEICTYEVAKLAKKKGFPQHIGDDAYIVENEYDDKYEVGCHYPISFIPDYLPTITAPTQSLLQRWLREEKNIHIEIVATACGYFWIADKTNGTAITNSDVLNRGTNEGGCFDTYELALEDAIAYSLKNLV
jgi:hypothetical protein